MEIIINNDACKIDEKSGTTSNSTPKLSEKNTDIARYLVDLNYFTKEVMERVLNMPSLVMVDKWLTNADLYAKKGLLSTYNPYCAHYKAHFRSMVPVMELFAADGSLNFESNTVRFDADHLQDDSCFPNYLQARDAFDSILDFDEFSTVEDASVTDQNLLDSIVPVEPIKNDKQSKEKGGTTSKQMQTFKWCNAVLIGTSRTPVQHIRG